ncbi:hypothetical protein [Marinivivus vitaminiproducens]|uniref:hypothetical protein n=1 Tax=Marinivivus vitaminiproducens TaxID=3035935 RepID=UPI0027A4E17A|nr:hypothetical protein P4R82_23635 [Geminicoccaceae bacterium SCSIO 64248]
MSKDLIACARTEALRLRRELEATPAFRRLHALEQLLAAYGEAVTPEAMGVSGGADRAYSASRQPRNQSTTTARAIQGAADYLRQIQRRAQSLEIMQYLEAQGLEFRGKKPTTVVASILSHSDLFDNVRGEGYGLREWLPRQEPFELSNDPTVEELDRFLAENAGGSGDVHEPDQARLDSDEEIGSNDAIRPRHYGAAA